MIHRLLPRQLVHASLLTGGLREHNPPPIPAGFALEQGYNMPPISINVLECGPAAAGCETERVHGRHPTRGMLF